jgi:Caspase domain
MVSPIHSDKFIWTAKGLKLATIKLVAFCAHRASNQFFDEVIVMENDQASFDNIRYFLRDYPRSRAIAYSGKTRFLFAYSGHGIPKANAATGSLVLANAASSGDISNLFQFNELKALLENLAAENYHVLALINACYGGGLFEAEIAGGVLNNPDDKGAHAMTAGPSDSLVYALPGKNAAGEPRGSIFFENLVRGISSGDADQTSRDYPTFRGRDGEPRQTDQGMVRLGALDTWLAGQIDMVNDQTGGNPDTQEPYVRPVLGSVARFDVTNPGAFSSCSRGRRRGPRSA